tara:strand:- start:160 stop:999 length:840 start_codon:yes stop_codon:yes gene_type:complete
MSKCPVPKGFKIPRLTDIWSEKLSSQRKSMPRVAYTLPRPNQVWGQLENQDPQSMHPPINFRNPQKFIKAPNGCVSTQFMRNRMYEVYFPWSYVKIRLGRNKYADEVDRFAGWTYQANYHGAVKHHGPFNEVIMEEKEAWGYADKPVMQISMPIMLFTDDPEVWMDVIPSDRNAGQNLPISTIPGFMPIYGWSRGLSWAFQWEDMDNLECNLNHDTVMFNLLFSKPVKIEYVEWNETFSKAWNQISQSSVNRRDTNMLYPDALERRPKKLMPKKKWLNR